MLGSIDCIHGRWEKCPRAWHGHFKGHYRYSTNHNSWSCCIRWSIDLVITFWFAMISQWPRCLAKLFVCKPNCHGRHHRWLSNQCPSMQHGLLYCYWHISSLVYVCKVEHQTLNDKRAHFASRQEACRKGVARAFGSNASSICHYSRSYMILGPKSRVSIMSTCVVMQNMIIEDERDQ